MFADIVGSTRLYETLGDQNAKALILRALSEMEVEIEQYNGEVVKTIGDELMVKFPHPDDAMRAAMSINELMDTKDFGQPVSVRIGMHCDVMISENGDLFGDGVNIAARIAGVARSKQVLTTKETYEHLSKSFQLQCRMIDKINVKGKKDPIRLYEVIWEHEDEVTLISGALDTVQIDTSHFHLSLRYMDKDLQIDPDQYFSVGRSPQADLPVHEALASRLHGRIEYRRDKFVFVDQSTNGTYIKIQGGDTRFIKREELPLWGQGIISLGADVDASQHLIYFACHS